MKQGHYYNDSNSHHSLTLQVTIRFDTNHHNILEVQQAALARLEFMRIPLANRFREPIAALVTQSEWMDFLKLDLLNPAKDGIALLRDHRILHYTP